LNSLTDAGVGDITFNSNAGISVMTQKQTSSKFGSTDSQPAPGSSSLKIRAVMLPRKKRVERT